MLWIDILDRYFVEGRTVAFHQIANLMKLAFA